MDADSAIETKPGNAARERRISDDWLAVLCGSILLIVGFLFVVSASKPAGPDSDEALVVNPLSDWLGKPSKWLASPQDTLVQTDKAGDPILDENGAKDYSPVYQMLGSGVVLAVLLTVAIGFRDGVKQCLPFAIAFAGVFALAFAAYVMAEHAVIKDYNLEYALWALLVGLVISNTIGTPKILRPAVQTEFFIKTGLVLLGAGVLLSRLLALGLPGVFVAWVVTPIVLISTYVFGQRVLKLPSRSLNMVISADMSVCGVSAAIAASAACKAKKEELSLAIGMSLSFTVLMMVVMPIIVRVSGMDAAVGAAWMGGTIDSTGAVAAAGAALGDQGLEIASTVKMIQNILIGVSAFGIAVYWVSYVEKSETSTRPSVREIWTRFPKFVLGFIGASIVFSCAYSWMESGPALVDAMVKGTANTLRGWLFCIAFVCIGLETRFSELMPHLRGGKPLVLYLCGQTLNLILTLIMAWLMFGVLFKDSVSGL